LRLRRKQYIHPLPDGTMTERLSQMTLARATRTDDQYRRLLQKIPERIVFTVR
jgi:hypothetical protein